MADAQYAAGRQDIFENSLGAQVQRLVSLGGAALSVALVVGLCLWGYRLAVRDVTGVPVVRAMEGPMRVAPADPEGEVMAHQGLSVNAVAADGTVRAPADQLMLAPQPVDLAAEDAAGTLATPAAPVSGRAEAAAGLTVAAAEPVPDPAPTPVDPITLALAEAGAIVPGLTDTVPLAGSLDAGGAAVTEVSMPGGARVSTTRPMPRPATLAAAEPAAPATQPEIDPATLAPGTRLVQLGAFDSPEAARADWARTYARFAELMRDKAPVIEAAQSGGRAFFRLRAHGFADEAAARRFCSALLAEQSACIPVTQR